MDRAAATKRFKAGDKVEAQPVIPPTSAPAQNHHNGWIGVDFDGTLSHYEGWRGHEFDKMGPPIPAMMERVKAWIAEGQQVKIFTARAGIPEQIPAVRQWLEHYGIGHLEITNVKDRFMHQLWDDRCVQVEINTGRRMDATQPALAPEVRDDIRPEVMAFAHIMEAKLKENDHKGGWGGCDIEWLTKRMKEEVAEVEKLLPLQYDGSKSRLKPFEFANAVGREAADVANFAMMIADIAGALSRLSQGTRV